MPDPYREPIEEPSVPDQETKSSPELKKEKPMESALNEKPAAVSPKPAPVLPTQPAEIKKIDPVLSPGASGLDNSRQLKNLIDLAFEQGINKAVEAARASGNAYLIDELHDTLVDELRQKLVEEKKLEDI